MHKVKYVNNLLKNTILKIWIIRGGVIIFTLSCLNYLARKQYQPSGNRKAFRVGKSLIKSFK